MNVDDLAGGETVICVNEQGWEDFEKGERYKVTGFPNYGDGVLIDGKIVLGEYTDDFIRDPLDMFRINYLLTNDVDAEGKGDGETQGFTIKNADTGHMTSIWENSDDPAEQLLFQLIKDGWIGCRTWLKP